MGSTEHRPAYLNKTLTLTERLVKTVQCNHKMESSGQELCHGV